MLDARQGRRRSPRRASHEGSENECEGSSVVVRLSTGSAAAGGGGPGTPVAKLLQQQSSAVETAAARSPLTPADNGGAPPAAAPSAAAAATAAVVAPEQQQSSAAVTPSKVKPPTAPGVSRFGFKPPPAATTAAAGSLSPRGRPAAATGASERSSGSSGSRNSQGVPPAASTGTTRAGARSAVLSPSRTGTAAAAASGGSGGSSSSSRATGGRSTATSGGRAATTAITRSRARAGAAAAAAGASGGRATRRGSGGASGSRARATRSGTAPAGTGRSNGGSRAASGTAAPSSRRLSHKLSQPIAVSGRMTRTATKVKPRLEFSSRAAAAAGGGGSALSMTSPSSGRTKRNAGAPGSATRRVHKSPRTSIDRDYTPLRSRTPGSEGRGGIRVHAQRIFTVSDDDVEDMLKTKVKGASKWDYKTRIQNQNELLAQLRAMLNTMLQQKQRFKDACIDTEAALKAEMRKVNSRCEDVERDHVELLDENARYQSVEAGLKADLKLAKEERALLRAENEKLATKADALRDGLSRAEGDLLKLEAKVADGEARTGEAETQLAMAREKLAWAEAQASMALAQKEQEWETRIDSATSGAHQEVAMLTARLEGKDLELESIREDGADMLQKTADLREELAVALGRAKEAEALLERGRADLERLEDGQRRAQSALDAKNQEMSSTLSTFAKSQMAANERESELKDARRALEERLSSLEAEKSSLSTELSSRDTGMASLTAEINLLKEQLMNASRESSEFRAELVEARMKAQQATETLAVEKEARLRAETKEEDERRERISTTAQTAAVQQQHSKEMEAERVARVKLETESEIRAQAAKADKAALREELVVAEERQLELEAEVRGLKAAVVDAQTNAEQLEEMSRAQGELEVLRRRLEALSKEKENVAIGASAKVEELEAKVLEGELQRRKMHNLIQELRGNVRVFARVRPFLPSDGVGPEEVPAVVGKGDGVGCVLSKRLIGDNGKELPPEAQSFSFDKCFPPSAGQEEVFTEVSEFVQSALDGFNVCLFSYGQTGSGKTHTMQGSGAGDMRGMIPRAMEQVGKYKSKLEAQGWEYEMQVSFLEIYNEQIRDLLRENNGAKDVKHEIKRDPRGNTTVTDLTMENVDPNDGAGVDEIMQRAACHRSVGRTDMNERSSRSHSVFTLYLKAVNQTQRSSLKGTLHLVDLAGSERLSRSNATGDRLKETVAINKSLSSLTDVFVSISNKSSHIPFRNSKLTYLLQPALSGDGKTLMMVNLSPTDQSYHESLCSLRFASQVNQCELGRPKRQLRDMSTSSEGGGGGSSSLQKATAASSRKGGIYGSNSSNSSRSRS